MDRITRNISIAGKVRAALFAAAGIFAAIFFVAAPSPRAQAATLSVITDSTGSVALGQPIKVSVALDTQGKNANAVQGEILFSSGAFDLSAIDDGNSIINFWIDPPQETAPGQVDFSGIIPGGFTGETDSLLSLLLTPTQAGTVDIRIASATVLANDGQGSSIPVTTADRTIVVSSSHYSGPPAVVSSTVSPDPFTPVVSRDPNLFNGHYFVAFQTADKGTGIDHYEVAEVPAGTAPSSTAWQTATSPYLLKDQTLSSDIYVRAVDHAGNATVAKVPAAHPPRNWKVIALVVAVILLLLIVVWMLAWRKKKGS